MKVNPPKINRNVMYIMPRQSGKTYKAIQHFLRDPENSVLVVENQVCRGKIRRHIPYEFHNKISIGIYGLRGSRYENIIIDDLPDYNYDIFDMISIGLVGRQKITIYSTSTLIPKSILKVFDIKVIDNTKNIMKDQIELVKEIMSSNQGYAGDPNDIIEYVKDNYMKLMGTKNIDFQYLIK
jgi:hypothetical protein